MSKNESDHPRHALDGLQALEAVEDFASNIEEGEIEYQVGLAVGVFHDD